jgi:hypothetical protein
LAKAKVLPKMLRREFSRVASKLRFRAWGRGRAPSLSWEMSDRGVVTSWDLRGKDDVEFWRPNRWPRPFVGTFLVSLCRILVSTEKHIRRNCSSRRSALHDLRPRAVAQRGCPRPVPDHLETA